MTEEPRPEIEAALSLQTLCQWIPPCFALRVEESHWAVTLVHFRYLKPDDVDVRERQETAQSWLNIKVHVRSTNTSAVQGDTQHYSSFLSLREHVTERLISVLYFPPWFSAVFQGLAKVLFKQYLKGQFNLGPQYFPLSSVLLIHIDCFSVSYWVLEILAKEATSLEPIIFSRQQTPL